MSSPADILRGKWLGHPLHPILVHLPIGLFMLSFVLDLWAYASPAVVLVRASFWLMALGVVGALLAAAPGLADYTSIRRDHPGRRTATLHMILNLAATGLYVVNLFLRRDRLLQA